MITKLKRLRGVRVIHPAPGKKGKQEYRWFDTWEDAQAYLIKNQSNREHGKPGRIAVRRPAREEGGAK